MPNSKRIGFVDRSTGTQCARAHAIAASIEEWAGARGINAVLWTDLPPNFEERLGKKFSIETAASHVRGLTPEEFEDA